ncbi:MULTISPECIES: glycosyltransferase [unclassified Aureimonas]|uniref:glycosyltransferase n=1 Tax=unclassified Aureimonas TaxID=2615206 RepID=UPI0006FC0960|nr:MULTISPECIES: glycosyltransferase [unclassified Aureimonas]KQT61255.1 hypothetical protein ASG54_24270 [Aureimonas sp. Leaf460]KQT68704.1 hypothetical protein ASG62_19030 [Aureimonas sp. Leaf427]
MRALVVSHGHPDFGPGGGELAAYALFQGLSVHPDIGEARFLARTGEPRLPQGAIGCLRPGEYLIRRDIADWPLLKARPDEAPPGRGLRDFLAAFSPDVVFLHHVVHLGLDVIAEIRSALPKARIVLTLHDYLGICRNQGLMITRVSPGAPPLSSALCAESGIEPCARCFPEDGQAVAAERLARFRAAFAKVDAFVGPSVFLAERYRRWGLDPARLHVIANGMARPGEPIAPPVFGPTLALGFFGQARPPKGLHLALAALHHLEPVHRARIRLEVNASRIEAQEGWYRALVERLAEPLREAGVLRWRGAYTRGELGGRMAAVDAVLVPSLWWENAPLVIDEAFAHGRPVLAARLGGMAEAVRDGVGGLLFEPGDARALADVLRRLLMEEALGPALAGNLTPPPTVSRSAEMYLDLARS